MNNFTQDFQHKFKQLNVFEKLIAVNIVVFILAQILRFALKTSSSLAWFELPSDIYAFLMQPWSIITYAFVHYEFIHTLFNLLWLYFIGRMFLNMLPTKLALNVYFLGIIFGALAFLLGYNLLPGFFNPSSKLVGASAGVRALIIFMCAYIPNMDLRFFTFNIKLKHIGIAIVAIDFLGLFGANAGGNLAHFGGSILGYFYATQFTKGKDIGKGFEKYMDSFMALFKNKPSNLKTVHKKKGKVAGYTKEEFQEFNNQKKIDIILDKISKSGYDSLTKEEKELLFRAGK
ncbi:rhomboid family intramembrane serine protease [Oceanihabitans sediminis]|uniref:Rhomboid family intramembrane serine protease n=1 Tax=Oceanihabitans sediminis TaxID=1812012 RepID=A0A368P2X3_9FLAO|nr:rhomboid family intramembrane serine protease [Oceanihabitans sediminis]MDX1277951.1 rhomboid family intramembrane serine protease [Oceanihabitans sediminis]MDX1774140.1 rhomboid family intramembrane serine protease [Oceanihabitans sediminis]RBP30820.1 membrane associated rhomboid family serine protease [Oceanihabitans sediminis]RCU56786.1 rhomboid family intramembrane serine protease [Oceanihabitans sediminis]